jgi:hypothetical protein
MPIAVSLHTGNTAIFDSVGVVKPTQAVLSLDSNIYSGHDVNVPQGQMIQTKKIDA